MTFTCIKVFTLFSGDLIYIYEKNLIRRIKHSESLASLLFTIKFFSDLVIFWPSFLVQQTSKTRLEGFGLTTLCEPLKPFSVLSFV